MIVSINKWVCQLVTSGDLTPLNCFGGACTVIADTLLSDQLETNIAIPEKYVRV